MPRALVIPAAGRGSRLGLDVPKVLAPVAGRPMIDWLLELYQPYVDLAVLVVQPAALSLVRDHVSSAPLRVALVVQEAPTGMLDAILLARDALRDRPDQPVWITWCDQIGIHPGTVSRLAAAEQEQPAPALVLPTCRCAEPYTHFERGPDGRITGVLHRREGDPMPPYGESDAGLFALSAEAFHDLLPQFAREVERAPATGERNFVPFVPWLSARRRVVSFPCEAPEEAVGVNTPEDLALMEAHLRARSHA